MRTLLSVPSPIINIEKQNCCQLNVQQMHACTFRSKREYYWMKSMAVWDKRRGDEEVSRAICSSPTEEKGWNGEREALSLSMQTLSESKSLAKDGKRVGRGGWNGRGEGWYARQRLQEGIKDEEKFGKESKRLQCNILSCGRQLYLRLPPAILALFKKKKLEKNIIGSNKQLQKVLHFSLIKSNLLWAF